MNTVKYQPADREHRVLDQVENPRYDRQILNGLDPFINGTAPEDMRGFYSPSGTRRPVADSGHSARHRGADAREDDAPLLRTCAQQPSSSETRQGVARRDPRSRRR